MKLSDSTHPNPCFALQSAQSTRTNCGFVTLLKISDCKASLPINTNSETPTRKQRNKHHIHNLARYFKFCTYTETVETKP